MIWKLDRVEVNEKKNGNDENRKALNKNLERLVWREVRKWDNENRDREIERERERVYRNIMIGYN